MLSFWFVFLFFFFFVSQLRLTSVSSSFPSLPFLSTFSANPGPGHRFRSKYHPDLTSRLQAEAQTSLFNRLKVFLFLTENGWFDNILMDIEQAPAIIKILDAGGILSLPDTIVATWVTENRSRERTVCVTCASVWEPLLWVSLEKNYETDFSCYSLPPAVIKMEGGTDHDLRILDMPSEEEEDREKLMSVTGGAEAQKRDDVKTLDGERKSSMEKDKNHKVCFRIVAKQF